MEEASDRDEAHEWIVFSRSWAMAVGDEHDVVCQPCADRRAVRAWAQGRHDHRPPDGVLKSVLNRLTWGA